MGTAKNKAKVAKGSVKEKVGKATKNRSLEAKGKKDKAAGELKQAGASSTTAAARAGTWSTIVGSATALIVGTFLGIAIAKS
jgi:uncharacterized protein YjbJ (UPF0337 family)